MPTTTRGNVTTPDGTDPNDFALAMGNLAQDTMDAVYAEGPVSGRPAASTCKGLFFRTTDTNTSGGWFASDGTAWVRLTPSPWVSWTPTKAITDGSGNVSATVFASYSTAGLTGFVYRVLPGNAVEVDVEYLVSLYGVYDFCGLWITTPVDAAKSTLLIGEMHNDMARCQTRDTVIGNAIQLFPHTGYAANAHQFDGSVYIGRWYVSGSVTARIHGTYPV